jgi:LemA protein
LEKRVVFWRDSRFAAIVMALLIVSGSLLGAGKSLRGLKNAADAAFYSGVGSSGFSIQRDLDERVISATNLITVARRYLPESDGALQSFVKARDDLAGANGIREKFDANVKLSAAAADLVSRAEREPLDDRDAAYLRSIPVDMQSRNDTISRDGYNDFAAQYNDTLSRFPANFFAAVLGIGKAELFR